jgi:hypothetical protein
VVLSPLRKQGDISKDPIAPTAVFYRARALLRRPRHHMHRALTPLRQPRRHVHRALTPIVHLGPLLTSINGRSRALVRGGGRAGGRADGQALSLSPSRTLVTPYCKRIHPGRRTTRSRGFPPLCVPSRADPSGLGHAATIYSSVQGPPEVETPQLARQVGACCVLTNSFPSSSRWVVSSNLSSPRRCSVSGVSSSCPSTATTTWYSFLCRCNTLSLGV